MGNCWGDSKEAKIKLYEERLYALCIKYNFDIDVNQPLSFNEMFRRENCNEMGEQFNEDSSKIIIMEFRKFLFITAAEMSRIRRTTGYKKLNPRQFNDGKTAVCYECPYNAPPYVDRVWRAVIAYDAKYKDICYKLCFGYLLRKDPRANLDLSFKRYNDCRLDLYKRCEKVVPFHNCWPKYHTQEEFYNDFVYTVWASPTTINNFKLHLATVPVQPGTINAQLLIENSKKIKSDFQRSFPPECQGRPNGQQNTMNMAAVVNHPFLKTQDPNWRAGALVRIMKEYLPFNFDQYVSQELMVSIDQAQDMIFEYRRFLLLYGLTNFKLYPSEQIEKVWLIHMSFGVNYIDFCSKTINFVPYHVPFTGNTTGYDDRTEYNNTLGFYTAIFGVQPCSSCWPPAELRFNVENFQCMFINLIRLAGFFWAHQLGNLSNGSPTLAPRNNMGATPQYVEKKEKMKHKKGSKAGMIAAGVAVGAGVILVGGGLALVAYPDAVDYNDTNLLDTITDGLHDGLSALGELSFGDLADVGEGALGVFEDIDWPDIDFDGFADVAGDLFGDAGEFFEGVGEAIADGAGDAVDGIGDVAEGIGDAFDW